MRFAELAVSLMKPPEIWLMRCYTLAQAPFALPAMASPERDAVQIGGLESRQIFSF